MRNLACLLAALALTVTLAGCRINVDKNADGKEKNVRVDTPFGGVHVNTDQTTASDLGLPLYPGAQPIVDKDDHNSADVRLGFGDWQLRIRAVSYESADPQQKVADFYKKALHSYGDVVTCQDKTPVGKPTVTREGLGCEQDEHGKIDLDSGGIKIGSGYELKAGSKRHQHIVGFESSAPGKTRFSLVALDLPDASNKNSSEAN